MSRTLILFIIIIVKNSKNYKYYVVFETVYKTSKLIESEVYMFYRPIL